MKKTSLGKDALYLSGSRIVIAFISLATSMLLARFRTLEEYGTYSQIIMVSDLISTVLLLGLPNSINYFLSRAESDKERQKFISVYYTVSTVICLFIGALSVLSIPLIEKYFDNPLIISFWYVLAIYPWASFIISGIGNICIVHGKTDKLVIYNFVFAVSNLLILLTVKAMNWSFMTFMIIYMIFYAGCAAFIYWWSYKIVGGYRIIFEKKLVKEIFTFAVPLGLASVVGTLCIELDKLVISAFYTTGQYAVYACASKEIPVTMIVAAFTSVLLPRLVRYLKRNDNLSAAASWSNCNIITFSVISLFACGMFVFAPDVIYMLYGTKYLTGECISVFRIFCFVLLIKFTYFGIILNSVGKTKTILFCSIASLALNLICNIAFCYLFGFTGPAYATLFVLSVMSILQLAFTAKVMHIKIIRLFEWIKLARLLLSNVVFGAYFYILKYYLAQQNSWNSVFSSIGLAVIWAVIFILFNIKMLVKSWRAINTEDKIIAE